MIIGVPLKLRSTLRYDKAAVRLYRYEAALASVCCVNLVLVTESSHSFIPEQPSCRIRSGGTCRSSIQYRRPCAGGVWLEDDLSKGIQFPDVDTGYPTILRWCRGAPASAGCRTVQQRAFTMSCNHCEGVGGVRRVRLQISVVSDWSRAPAL